MAKQKSITRNPLLDALIADYQSSYWPNVSWSDAVTRLLIRGLVAWIEEDDCDTSGDVARDGLKPSNVNKLLGDYSKWRSQQANLHGWLTPDDMTFEEQQSISLHSYLSDQIIPKRGGKREGAGRKKAAAANE